MVYSQNRRVDASMCGTEAKLSLVGILSLVEDALTDLMAKLEIDGLTAIRKYHAILVYAKNHIRIFRSASWQEPLVVESFLSGKRRASFCVDVFIYNGAREIVACSRIEICGIDMETKRLRKTDTLGLDDTVEPETPVIDIPFFGHREHIPSYVESIRVRTSNIDYLHHTNNIEYLRFILDTFSVAELEACPVGEMELSYANQSYEGDTLDIYSEKCDGGRYYEIKKQDTPVLRCELQFR